jgi:hypothetical protein
LPHVTALIVLDEILDVRCHVPQLQIATQCFWAGKEPVPGAIFSAMEKAMEKKLWKLIANVPGIAGKPGVKEYYVVREVDEQNAIVALLCARADLQAATVELRGQADQAFIEWVQPNRDVFQVMVVS